MGENTHDTFILKRSASPQDGVASLTVMIAIEPNRSTFLFKPPKHHVALPELLYS
jgi:hypothetical protein